MNPWPFIFGSYGVAAAALIGLASWSWMAMRRAEADAQKLGRDREA